MKKYISIALLFLTTFSYAQTCNCDSTFQIVKYHIETNYAGWFDKSKQFDKIKFAELTNNIALESKSITADSLCYREIKKYVDYFQDGHLHLNIRHPKTQTINNKDIVVEKITTTENELLTYLKSSRQLNKAEGIWENETYKIGILKSKKNPNILNGFILTSKNENWTKGEIKLTIDISKSYTLNFITGDKTEVVENKAILFKNILDAKELILSRVFPESKDTISLDDYALENDPLNPKLNFPKTDLAVWTFPNFYSQNTDVVETLLEKHKTKLETTKNWIIDLRKNEGGDVRVGNLLLPFLNTRPIVWYNEFSRLTQDNFNKWYNTYIREQYETFPKEKQQQYDSVFAITKTHFGKFGNWNNKNEIADTIKFESKKMFPESVVILIDNNTFSSGELFTILARQSDKVLVLGEKTAGSIDYGNILTYKTNCPNISITLPSSRNNWLDFGISIDRDKVQPDIYIPRNVTNWIDFAYKIINDQKKNGR